MLTIALNRLRLAVSTDTTSPRLGYYLRRCTVPRLLPTRLMLNNFLMLLGEDSHLRDAHLQLQNVASQLVIEEKTERKNCILTQSSPLVWEHGQGWNPEGIRMLYSGSESFQLEPQGSSGEKEHIRT